MKKLLIYVVLFFLLAFAANAVEVSDLTPYLMVEVSGNINETLDSSTNAYNGIESSDPQVDRVNYQLGNGSVDFSNDNINFTDTTHFAVAINQSVSCWFRTSASTQYPVGKNNAQTGTRQDEAGAHRFMWHSSHGCYANVQLWNGGGIDNLVAKSTSCNSAFNSNTFNLVTYTITEINGQTNISLYFNTTLLASAKDADDGIDQLDYGFEMGGLSGGGNYVGQMQCQYYNKSLSQDEIDFLWARTEPLGIAGAPPAASTLNMTINAKTVTGSDINTFDIRLEGQGQAFNLSTTNGTIYLFNVTESEFYNLTFRKNDYMPRTYEVNVSGQTFIGAMYQAIVEVNASEIITGDPITTFDVTSPFSNSSNSSGVTRLYFMNGTHNIGGTATGYITANTTHTVTHLGTSQTTLEFPSNQLRIDALSLINNGYVQNFTIILDSANYDYNTTTITLTGNVTIPLLNGTYYLNFTSPTHSKENLTVVIDSTSLYPNVTFEVYTLNSINLTFFDEILGASNNFFFNRTVNIEISSSVFSQNYTTNTGHFYVDLLTPAEYRIAYTSDDYKERFYYFTMTNQTHSEIDLYLLSLGNSTDVTLTIEDNSGLAIEDALVRLRRYYVDTNSYVIVAMARSNFEGQIIFDVDYDDAFYQVYATDNGFSTTTAGSKIFTTSINVKINTLDDPFESIDAETNTDTSITFNNETGYFSFNYDAKDGINKYAELEVYQGDTLICSNSGSGASGTLLCYANTSAANTTYTGKGFIAYNEWSQRFQTAVEIVDYSFRKQIKDRFQLDGVLVSVITAGTLAGLGVFNIAVSIILFIVGLASMVALGFTAVNISLFIGITILGLLVIWRLKT